MYTGYFAQIRKYRETGLVPISIARFSPKWYSGIEYKKLAPTEKILFDWKYGEYALNENWYKVKFANEILKSPNHAYQVLRELEDLASCSHNKIILLCYERPFEFCHRHLVSNWFRNADIYREEFKL